MGLVTEEVDICRNAQRDVLDERIFNIYKHKLRRLRYDMVIMTRHAIHGLHTRPCSHALDRSHYGFALCFEFAVPPSAQLQLATSERMDLRLSAAF